MTSYRSPLPSLELLPHGSTCKDCGADVGLTDFCSECHERNAVAEDDSLHHHIEPDEEKT